MSRDLGVCAPVPPDVHMPALGAKLVDAAGAELVAAWIAQLGARR